MLYDLNGNRIGKSGERLGADGKLWKMDTAYSYDHMNRLTEERREEAGDRYSYDLAGNRLKKQSCHYALISGGETVGTQTGSIKDIMIDGEETYCYNERNELTERRTLSAVTQYLYDENGSLVSEKEGERKTSYQYDLLNRQTHVRMPDGREQENFYDGEGLRAGISESGKASTFIFHNGEILAECDKNNSPLKRYLQGLSLSCVQTLNDSVCHVYHQDEQGSTAYITGGNGVVENCYRYDAFGNVLESREDISNRILYTGQQYDQETGQYYLRARFYNPVIGRFTQEDTYRGDGLNLYAYCGNNPVIYYDPSGHSMSNYNTQPTAELESTKNVDGQVDKSSIPTQEQMHSAVTEWSRMEESLADSNRKLNKFNTATVAYDSNTGDYYYGMNRGIQLSGDNLNASLESWLPDSSLNEFKLGNCAEVDAVNQALNAGADVSGLYIYTINTKTNMPKQMCKNCSYTFVGRVAEIFSH